jgi:hypothetical protein
MERVGYISAAWLIEKLKNTRKKVSNKGNE